VAKRFDMSYWADVIGIFLRELVETMALVVILGLLPVGAHYLFSLEKMTDNRRWVVPELYLFVMVTCGQAAGDAFRDTRRGLRRTLVGIAGALGVLGAAGAYGLLYVEPVSTEALWLEQWLRSSVITVMLCVAAGYALYRGTRLFVDARVEAAKNSCSQV
jgi:nitrate/nitrite transporter NarK